MDWEHDNSSRDVTGTKKLIGESGGHNKTQITTYSAGPWNITGQGYSVVVSSLGNAHCSQPW